MNFRLKKPVKLSEFVIDPFFTHVKDVGAGVVGDSVTYSCKVLDLSTIPEAKIGDVVLVFVKYTHNELSLEQIDTWMKLYGTLKSKSR
jgi:hypothetical protein